MKKLHSHWFIWLVLLIVSLLPLFDLFNSGLPITHDGKDHVARIANFYQSFSEGNVVPRWAGNLNWGYGHPVMMFLYPLPSYIASAFHAIGFSFVDSVKLVFAFGFIASIFAMFLWVSAAWGTEAGITAAVLYGFAPYRFVDIYIRGAIGEHVAFIFLPFVMFGLYMLAKQSFDAPNILIYRYMRIIKAEVMIMLGVAGLILSHNALSIMFLPIAGVYALYLFVYESKDKRRFFITSVICMTLGFILSAFFWIPAFVEGKYTLRDIVTVADFKTRFVPLRWFLWSAWNYGGGNEFSKSLGVGQLLGLVLVLVKFSKANRKMQIFTISAISILIVSLFLMTNAALPVWQSISLLQKFQFPWRLMSVAVFATSIIGAIGISIVSKKEKIWMMGLLCTIAIVGTIPMWHAKEYVLMPDSNFTSVYNGTTDTGESSPIWSIRFMETKAKAPIEVISGKDVSITIGRRNSTYHSYTVSSLSPVKLVENTLYFPNWEVFVDKTRVPVEFQNPNYRGLLTFDVPAGVHDVEIIFSDTKLRTTANWISIGGIFILLGFLATMRLWQKRR